MSMRTNFKVLIADDHFMARQMVTTALQKHNITNVVSVSDGKSAIEAIETAHKAQTPFHIVFLDWDMPNGSGLDVLLHFRKQAAFADTAFVMLTAVAQQTDVLQAVKAGATAYIIKPVSRAKIDEKIVEICAWVRKTEAKSA